jgi:hypothetical protein
MPACLAVFFPFIEINIIYSLTLASKEIAEPSFMLILTMLDISVAIAVIMCVRPVRLLIKVENWN